MKLHVAIFCTALLALSVSGPPAAASIAGLTVFGDSLSDTGNDYLGTGGQVPLSPPYAAGRFSNGPVWVEDLAVLLNVPVPTPSLAGGTNYAFGGAQAAGGAELQPPPLSVQISMYLAIRTPSPDDLFVVAIGGDDLLNGQADPTIPANAVQAGIAALAQAGARQFLVAGVPPLDRTPRFLGTPDAQPMNLWIQGYNAALDANLAALKVAFPTVTFYPTLSVYDLFNAIADNPAQYGLQNTTDPALDTNTNAIVPNPDQYLFWDTIHPTSTAHELLALQAYSSIVPEPTALSILLMAAFPLAFRRRDARIAGAADRVRARRSAVCSPD